MGVFEPESCAVTLCLPMTKVSIHVWRICRHSVLFGDLFRFARFSLHNICTTLTLFSHPKDGVSGLSIAHFRRVSA